jgi:hypothetical protein
MTESVSAYLLPSKALKLKDQDVTVRNPSLRDTIRVISKLLAHKDDIVEYFQSDNATDGANILLKISENDTFFNLYCDIASACSDKPASFYADLSLPESLQFIDALIEVVNFKQIYDLFQKTLMKVPALSSSNST